MTHLHQPPLPSSAEVEVCVDSPTVSGSPPLQDANAALQQVFSVSSSLPGFHKA